MNTVLKYFAIAVCATAAFFSCKSEDKQNDYFPVLSYLNSQVRSVDTGLYRIVKVVTVDSVSDTSYIKREDFRALAKDFLEIPDLTKSSIGKKYKEEKFFDETLNRVIFTYTPLKDNLELQNQQVTVIPNQGAENDKVSNIILDRVIDRDDSLIRQRLLWTVDESFQVVDVVEKNGRTVSTKKTEVYWNRPPEE